MTRAPGLSRRVNTASRLAKSRVADSARSRLPPNACQTCMPTRVSSRLSIRATRPASVVARRRGMRFVRRKLSVSCRELSRCMSADEASATSRPDHERVSARQTPRQVGSEVQRREILIVAPRAGHRVGRPLLLDVDTLVLDVGYRAEDPADVDRTLAELRVLRPVGNDVLHVEAPVPIAELLEV